MVDWDPIVIGIGLIGSSVVGAMTYSFRTGATHKEVLMELNYIKDSITRVEQDNKERITENQRRIEILERRDRFDGYYPRQRHHASPPET